MCNVHSKFKVDIYAEERVPTSINVWSCLQFTAKTAEARGAFNGPPEVAVPVATPSFYPLVFTPPRIGRFKACLTLSVAATQEKWTYNLEAVGQEPPATEHITFKSTAGSSKPLKLLVSNPLDTTVEYTVFTDMACMQGPASIEVPPRGTADYDLCLRPMLPGLLMGLVSFSTSTGQLQWYSFEVEVSEAPKIDAIHVQTAGAKHYLRYMMNGKSVLQISSDLLT